MRIWEIPPETFFTRPESDFVYLFSEHMNSFHYRPIYKRNEDGTLECLRHHASNNMVITPKEFFAFNWVTVAPEKVIDAKLS